MKNQTKQLFLFLLALIFLFLYQPLVAQVQLGSNLDAGSIEVLLSADGNRLAAYQPLEYFNSNRILSIYELIENEWVQLGDNIVGSIITQSNERTPLTITANGNRIAMGRIDESVQNVVTYDWDGENWTLQEAVIIVVTEADVTDWSLDISADGSRLAVGSASSDQNGINSGHTAVYDWDGTNWVQLGDHITGTISEARSGSKISLSSDANRLAIAAYGIDTTKVFEWDGIAWNQIGQDFYGTSLSLSGNGQRLAVSNPSADNGETEGGTRGGQLDMYEWDGNTWVQMGETKRGGYFSFLGFAIDFDETGTHLVCASRGAINLNDFGHMTILRWIEDRWITIGQHMVPGPHRTTLSGVSIAGDGSRVALRGRSVGVSVDNEVVRVFDMEAYSFSVNSLGICNDADARNFYFPVTPTGGVFSGLGVTDNGDGLSCTFDPSLVDSGNSPITYTADGQSGVDSILVRPVLNPTVTFPDTIYAFPGETIPNPILVEPAGGQFEDSGNYFTYNDNGTISFEHGSPTAYSTISISYTFYDPFCPNPITGEVVVVNEYLANLDSIAQPSAVLNGQFANVGFGFDLVLSADGNRIAVSAPYQGNQFCIGGPEEALFPGYVGVYERQGGNWVQLGTDLAGDHVGNQFGHVISLSDDGNRLAIGTPQLLFEESGKGKIGVYEWDGSHWTLLGEEFLGEGSIKEIGRSVTLSGDGQRLFFGERENTFGKINSYQWDGNNWSLVDQFVNGGVSSYTNSVIASSFNGDQIIVGSPSFTGSTGKAAVFQWNGSNYLQLGATFTGSQNGDQRGASVAISNDGTKIAIGKPGQFFTSNGSVQLYEWNSNFWSQIGSEIEGEFIGSKFGKSLAINADANRLVVGAPEADLAGENSGKVYVYDWNGTDWQLYENNLLGNSTGDLFGTAIDLSDARDVLAVGAPNDICSLTTNGTARIFTLSTEVIVNQTEGLEDFTNVQLKVFPNPTTGIVYFRGHLPEKMWLVDALGRKVWQTETPVTQLDISLFPSGAYTLLGSVSDGQWIRKILVKY